MKPKAKVAEKPEGRTKQAAKLDYNKFFLYLRENGPAPLLQLLRSIDKRASVKVAEFIAAYLQPPQPDEVYQRRKQRGQALKKALPHAIKQLRKAAASYREVARIEIPGAGSIIDARAPSWTQGMFLADAMEKEAARFSALLNDAKKLYSEKRFGLIGNHLWLLLLREFVAVWTKKERGETRTLSFDDIADLITAGKVALGWPEADTVTDPELMRKAVQNFRSNPTNKWISTQGVREQAELLCQTLKSMPFLLGIEI
jgi:hypothetical protein